MKSLFNISKKNIGLEMITILIVILCGLYLYKLDIDKIGDKAEESVINETENNITKYDMTEEDIKELPSSIIIEQSIEQEESAAKEQEIEEEGFQLQGDIAYEGAKARKWNVKLGNYIGLTYYSQLDSRWASKMYSSVNNKNQTIGVSGCGPACASMVVTATRGVITPDKMGELFVKYGYRSANNGTYFSAFRAIADEFDISYEETYYLDKAIELVRNNHYVVASCGNGLFTTGGHFVVLVGINGNMLKIYDPYLYSGKFETSTRRGKITVDGNTVYCSIDNFRKYANYSKFFSFAHDENVEENKQTVNTQAYTRYVNAKIGLNIRNNVNGNIVGSCNYGTSVLVYETRNGWSRIGENRWVSSKYLTSNIPTQSGSNNTNLKVNTTGKYIVNANILNVRMGPGTNYRIKNYKQLTSNARYQNRKLGNQYTNGLKRGVVTTVTRIQNGFGLTPSGWISLNYCTKI